jgi:hypothetical protein
MLCICFILLFRQRVGVSQYSLLVLQLVFYVVGLILGIVGACVTYYFAKKRRNQLFLLTNNGHALFDVESSNAGNSLPKMKNPDRLGFVFIYYIIFINNNLELSVRFIQKKEFRSDYNMLQYVDIIYTTAIKTHRMCSQLHFDYGNFLLYFRKNTVKAGLT